jgi:hypothetical protein
MNQWWNDSNKAKLMYQDTSIHPKLFSCDMRTEAHERMTAGMIISHQSSVYGLYLSLYCTLCE